MVIRMMIFVAAMGGICAVLLRQLVTTAKAVEPAERPPRDWDGLTHGYWPRDMS